MEILVSSLAGFLHVRLFATSKWIYFWHVLSPIANEKYTLILFHLSSSFSKEFHMLRTYMNTCKVLSPLQEYWYYVFKGESILKCRDDRICYQQFISLKCYFYRLIFLRKPRKVNLKHLLREGALLE